MKKLSKKFRVQSNPPLKKRGMPDSQQCEIVPLFEKSVYRSQVVGIIILEFHFFTLLV